ncbi:MAG: ribosome hibernation-promoting factor, HPF/YfiA family [Anaerolineales bacterium]|jgi:putative sigma-54 modulation protein
MVLEVKIFSRNLDVNEDLQDQINRKVAGLDRFLEDIIDARVDLTSTNAKNAEEREVAQITVQGKGFILRAEERSSDIVNALNMAVDTLQRRIKRYKGKRNQRWKQGLDEEDILLEVEDENWDDEPVIARRKQFSLRPMDEWEAIEQMELLGHNDFFVFYNAQTESINVLYRRNDGSFGLIEPVLG